MKVGDSKLLFLLLCFGVWLRTECFVLMRSTSSSLWQRRLFSATVRAAAVSTFRGGHNGLSQFFFPPVAAEHQGFFSWQQHSRLFSTSTSDIDSMVSSASENDGKYTDYEKWVRRLYMTNMFHPVKMGLTNMKKLHDLMSNPMDDPDRLVVHIAGTNGKGSVALKIANTLQNHGLKVGLFISPHVSSFRERMQINGQMISEEDVVELLPKVYEMCAKHDVPATFFEITTALAFMFYAKHGAQAVVLETGLGGRLDATNVIIRPALSVITSIGLEHTRILGETKELIAREKGGIIKPGRPVLVGPHCPQEVLQQCTREIGGGPYYVPESVLRDCQDDQITDYDEENRRIAKAALTLLKKYAPFGLQDLSVDEMEQGVVIRPPCRFEQVEKDNVTVILDVAHNPPAMEYLVNKLRSTHPDSSFRFVVGMSSDKDIGQCARYLLATTHPTSIHLVEAAHPRAAKLEAILSAEPALLNSQHDLQDSSITKQVDEAMRLAKQNGELLVVCGSVFLMAEAREALGFNEPRDSEYIAEMAGAGVRHGQENFGNATINEEKQT